jgi:phage-related protein
MDITPIIGTASGPGFNLFAIVIDNICLIREYIISLVEKDQKQTIALFKLILDSGLPYNIQKFRNIGEQIYELKTRGGVRIVGFFGGPNMPRTLILTHGFYKKHSKVSVREKKKAILWREEYFAGQVNIGIGDEH